MALTEEQHRELADLRETSQVIGEMAALCEDFVRAERTDPRWPFRHELSEAGQRWEERRRRLRRALVGIDGMRARLELLDEFGEEFIRFSDDVLAEMVEEFEQDLVALHNVLSDA